MGETHIASASVVSMGRTQTYWHKYVLSWFYVELWYNARVLYKVEEEACEVALTVGLRDPGLLDCFSFYVVALS